MQKIGFHSLYTFMDGPMTKPGSGKRSSVMAMFQFENNISFLFPYINAVAQKAELHDTPELIRFVYKDVYCVVYPERCIASPFKDREEAKQFRESLVEYLNSILIEKDEIIPKFKVFKKIAVTDILKLLPKNNCKECGFLSCMAFAAMLSKQQAEPSACPYIGRPLSEQVTYPLYDDKGNLISSVTLDVDRANYELPEFFSEEDREISEDILETANQSLPSALSKRELEVLGMMGKGLTNPEISDALFISRHTVKSHVVHIFNKLGVSQRTQAVVWAVRNGLV